MKIICDPTNPHERGYEEKANIEVRILADRVWYDEGYREAFKGETVKMDQFDFDNHELEGKVELEQTAAERDKRNAERAEKAAAKKGAAKQ